MRKKIFLSCAILASLLLVLNLQAKLAESLVEALEEAGWENIIGTWVDADTGGEGLKVNYKWRFPGKAIIGASWEKDKETMSIIGFNPKTREIFHVSADSQGGSSIGKWTTRGEEAILDALYITGNQEEGAIRIRYRFLDENTILMTVDLETPFEIKMIRVKDE